MDEILEQLKSSLGEDTVNKLLSGILIVKTDNEKFLWLLAFVDVMVEKINTKNSMD